LGVSGYFNVFKSQRAFIQKPKDFRVNPSLKIFKDGVEIKHTQLDNNATNYHTEILQCDKSYVFKYTARNTPNPEQYISKTFRAKAYLSCKGPKSILFNYQPFYDPDTCQNEGKVPVLLVPGILGSTTANSIGGGFWNDTYPDLPKESPA
jgi:hypothetical protein